MARNPGGEDNGHGEDDPADPADPQDGRHDQYARDEHSSGEGGDAEAPLPLDENAAWEQIVAAYGDYPKAEDMATGTPGTEPGSDARTGTTTRPAPGSRPDDEGEGEGEGDEGGTSVRSFTVYSAGSGPRDWSLPADDDEPGGAAEEDEGHFVPPEPPPLPQSDPTARFAWLAVLGGPLLLMFCVLFQQELTWWIATLGIGGFLGGFATLVARMRDGRDDDWDDPGRGAVV